MVSRQYIIQDEMGLHARSVSLIARLALSFPQTRITVTCYERTTQATHLTAMMAMLVKQGDQITITVDGGDEKKIADTILNTLKEKRV